MDIRLTEVSMEKREVLERLLQLYLHNISLFFPIDIDSNTGLYIYDDLNNYFETDGDKAFFIMKNEDLAGFMLINLGEENIIQEMFVLNNYKSQGIGGIAVKQVFDMYKGEWVIKALPGSIPAENFWVKTVENYTNGEYTLDHVGKYDRAILKFNNK